MHGEAIGKDEVRVLSRPNLERRIEELKQDAHTDEQTTLIAGIYVLREFCLTRQTNVFLVPEQLLQKDENIKSLFNRLMDYRIIHQAGSALTHKSTSGNFQAFAIDIGAYAHFRKMQGRFTKLMYPIAMLRTKCGRRRCSTKRQFDLCSKRSQKTQNSNCAHSPMNRTDALL